MRYNITTLFVCLFDDNTKKAPGFNSEGFSYKAFSIIFAMFLTLVFSRLATSW
jgi:hypothetical protein